MIIEPNASLLYDCQPVISAIVFEPLAYVMDRDELIQRIRDARTKAEISQREAAEKAGISQSMWAQLETRDHKPVAPETLVRMATAVGLSVIYEPERFVLGKKSAPRK
jgi:DNA-binding XRE family transcriptional regulator